MDAAQNLLSVWPGLPRLWRQGNWASLVLAVAFAGGLNFLLIATWVWPEWLAAQLSPWMGPGAAGRAAGAVLWMGWCGLACFWAWSVVRNQWESARPETKRASEICETLFPQAQTEYLKGHWIEAERLLRAVIGKSPQDVEANLLLVSVLRRAGRSEEAVAVLRELEQMPLARRWAAELTQERELLARGSPEAANRATQRNVAAGKAEDSAARAA